MPSPFSNRMRMADRLTGGIEQFLRERREQGVSYEGIMHDLADVDVFVSSMAIRMWCQHFGIEKGEVVR